MDFPFSILNKKQDNKVIIIHENKSSNINMTQQAIDTKILDMTKEGVTVSDNVVNYIKYYANEYSRNNIHILYLAYKLKNEHNFKGSQEYLLIRNFIIDKYKNINVDRLDVMLDVYIMKIDNIDKGISYKLTLG